MAAYTPSIHVFLGRPLLDYTFIMGFNLAFKRLIKKDYTFINPLNAKLSPICHFLALFGAHPILHVRRIRVNLILSSLPPTVLM